MYQVGIGDMAVPGKHRSARPITGRDPAERVTPGHNISAITSGAATTRLHSLRAATQCHSDSEQRQGHHYSYLHHKTCNVVSLERLPDMKMCLQCILFRSTTYRPRK